MNKEITYLIFKKHEQTLTPREEEDLNQWIQKSAGNQKYAENLFNILKEGENAKLPVSTAKQNVWQIIEQRINDKSSTSVFNNFMQTVDNFFRRRSLVYISAVLIFLILGYGLFNILFNPYESMVTEKGERTTVVLADGSSIMLNNDSKIKFTKDYGARNRKVYLSGEAFFQVLPAEFPFVVETRNTKSTVIGTSFNIWARKRETRIVVKEGKVIFESSSKQVESVILSKGQMSCVIDEESPQKPKSVNLNEKLGWLDGKLVFRKTPLLEVASELERYYNVTIKFAHPELAKKTITATIYKLSIDQAIKPICETMQIKYEKKGRTFILYNGKRK